MPDIALQILDKRTTCELEMFFIIAWSIWYNRNLVVFESICKMPSHIWRFASRYLYEYRSARVAVDKGQRAEYGGWSPPPPGVFKVNVDGGDFGGWEKL